MRFKWKLLYFDCTWTEFCCYGLIDNKSALFYVMTCKDWTGNIEQAIKLP